MNRNFAGRFQRGSRQGHAQGLSASPPEEFLAAPSEEGRARRRRSQRLVLLAASVVTLFSLAGMIITRAMEIASL